MLECNVIDTVYLPSIRSIMCSMDPIRLPFSVSEGQPLEKQAGQPVISLLRHTPRGWNADYSSSIIIVNSMQDALKNQKTPSDEPVAKGQSYKEILYSLENLRKRGSEE